MLPIVNIFTANQATMTNAEGAVALTDMLKRIAGNGAPWQVDAAYEHISLVTHDSKYWMTKRDVSPGVTPIEGDDWTADLMLNVNPSNVVPQTDGNVAISGTLSIGGSDVKSAAFADILGTVSQSAGVPTGAIIESGSNANGEYVKYADGTQICTLIGFEVDVVSGDGTVAKTFPSIFISAPAVLVSVDALYWSGCTDVVGVTSANVCVWKRDTIGTGTVTASYSAIGRWF